MSLGPTGRDGRLAAVLHSDAQDPMGGTPARPHPPRRGPGARTGWGRGVRCCQLEQPSTRMSLCKGSVLLTDPRALQNSRCPRAISKLPGHAHRGRLLACTPRVGPPPECPSCSTRLSPGPAPGGRRLCSHRGRLQPPGSSQGRAVPLVPGGSWRTLGGLPSLGPSQARLPARPPRFAHGPPVQPARVLLPVGDGVKAWDGVGAQVPNPATLPRLVASSHWGVHCLEGPVLPWELGAGVRAE